MKEIKNKYGLREKKTGKLLSFNRTKNRCDAVEYCHDLRVDENSETWLVDNPRQAEWVRHNSTEWYNADHNTPRHHYEAHELEVVEVNVSIRVTLMNVKVPTPYEYFKSKYAKKDPRHWASLQEAFKDKRRSPTYSWWELELLEEERDKCIKSTCPTCKRQVIILPEGGKCECGDAYELFDNFNDLVWESQLPDIN